MTSLFSTHRRAEEFAAVVDGSADRAPEDLRALVGVVTELRTHAEHADAAPRPEFAAELRSRLMAEAEEALVPGPSLVLPARTQGRRERRLVAAATAAILVGGSAGMAAAAQDALPGDALYPIKRGIERAEAGLSVSTAGRGRDLLHQATDRLDEVAGLLATDTAAAAPQVPGTLTDFTEQAREGSNLLMTAFAESRDPATIVTVREFAADGIASLQQLAESAPASAQPQLAEAALTLADIDEQADQLCGSCAADLPSLQVPGMFLAASEAGRALSVLEVDELDNSHPVVVDKRSVSRDERNRHEDKDSKDGVSVPAPSTSLPPATDDADALPGLPLPTEGGATKKKGSTDLGDTTKKVTDGVGDTVGGLSDGLDGIAETLLPEPDLGLD